MLGEAVIPRNIYLDYIQTKKEKQDLAERRPSWPVAEFELKDIAEETYKSFIKETRKSIRYPLLAQFEPGKEFPTHLISSTAHIPSLLGIMDRQSEAVYKAKRSALEEGKERIKKMNVVSDASISSDDESVALRICHQLRMLSDVTVPMTEDFREFLEHLARLPEILHICVEKTVEDTHKSYQISALKSEGMFTPQLLTAFSSKYENWLPIRNTCVEILKRNSHALHRMMKFTFRARLITSFTCFIASVVPFWIKNKAFHWLKYLTLTSSVIIYLGMTSFFLVRTKSRRLLDEAVDVIVYEEHEYQNIISSLYMNDKVYKKIQDLSQFININWINVKFLHNYFERERKEHPWSKFLRPFNFWPDDVSDCSKLYFTLLLSAAVNDLNVLREKSAREKIVSFSFSPEGIAFWRCMNLQNYSTLYTRVILRLQPFPKRHMIFSLPFLALPFWLYSTHPAVLAGKLIFCAASAFDAFRNLRRGIESEQFSRMLELSNRLKEEEEEIKRIVHQLQQRNSDVSSILMP